MRIKVTYLLLLLLLAGQMATTACTSSSSRVREAERIIAIADSMDAEHQLYSDTVALRAAIRTLRKPIARHLHRNTLAAAYYYMGRNLEDNCSLIPDAADCYIACDRLHPDDPIRRGRVNACMAYICSQQAEDSLALVFRQRSTEAFRESGDTARYTYGLLFLSENYCQLGEYQIADSLWREAQTFPLDSAHYACLLETRGICFYDRQQYDSALTCFLQVINVPRGEEYKCFDYMKIAQIYESINKSAQAYPYAEYIVRHSANPYLISNAYYTLIKHAKQAGDIELVATYSHNREDVGREKREMENAYTMAVAKCRDYIVQPHPYRSWKIAVCITILACGLLFLLLLLLQHHKRIALWQRDAQIRAQGMAIARKNMALQDKDAVIEELKTQLQTQTTMLQHTAIQLQQAEQQLQHKTSLVQDLVHWVNTQREPEVSLQLEYLQLCYPHPDKRWNTYSVLQKDMGHLLLGVCKHLERKSLSPREITVCMCSLIYTSITLADMAQYLCYSENSIRAIRTRIAKKLGIDSAAKLHKYLMDLAVYGTDIHPNDSNCIHNKIAIR